tara:strand:+ start:6776 stop:7537 length:762 start_codon:yes stop_codon:yes gene_type:complete
MSEFQKVSENLTDENLPCISILIPCWRRRKFIPLMLANILNQNYPKDKIEVVILQDGDQDLFIDDKRKELFLTSLGNIKLNYKYEPNHRRTIGEKRNLLVKMATHKICAMMDSDDIYLETYLRYSVNALHQYKAGITSSNSMLFVYPKDEFKMSAISCDYKHMCHEACAVFTKKYFKSLGGFSKSSQGEGVKMFQGADNKIVNIDISKLMVCVCHQGEEGNTIDKKQFEDENKNVATFQDGCWKTIITDILLR